MFLNKVKGSIKIIVVLTFILMIVVNFLANTIPINGQTTGEVADSYPNLFAPAGITFAMQLGFFHGIITRFLYLCY